MTVDNHAAGQSHGMGTEWVNRDWREIDLEDIGRLLSFYPELGKAIRLIWHSPRPFSSAAIVSTEQGRIFVKRHHISIRDEEGLLEEHRFIRHLRGQGIRVNEPVQGLEGRSAHTLGEWTYEIFGFASGKDVYRDSFSWTPFRYPYHAYAAGQALARLHLASSGYEAPARPCRPLISSFSIFSSSEPAARLNRYIEERPPLGEYLQGRSWTADVIKLTEPFHSELQLYAHKLEPLWTHNDLHASNLLWTGEGEYAEVETILDFGLSDCTNAVYDLATTIERNIIEWLRLEEKKGELVHYDQLEALLAGYESIRPLSAEESLALAPILPLIHIEYALSEIHYFAGIIQSRSNADLAYEAFLLGHAQWFFEDEGSKLLDFLRRRSVVRSGNR